MQAGGLATLASRQLELQQDLERLTTVMNRLNSRWTTSGSDRPLEGRDPPPAIGCACGCSAGDGRSRRRPPCGGDRHRHQLDPAARLRRRRRRDLGRIDRLLTITRLGDGVDHSGTINAAALERAHAALSRYHARAAELGAEHVLAVATSAVRDASNGRELIADIGQRYGFETRILNGDEEARTTFRGVTSRRPADPGTLICDIGGGSTEFVLGDAGGVREQQSIDMGCVRLSERYLHDTPPGDDALTALRATARELIPHATPARRSS